MSEWYIQSLIVLGYDLFIVYLRKGELLCSLMRKIRLFQWDRLLDGGCVWINSWTKKDHFPMPFMDQMLDRLDEKGWYYFLDGSSGSKLNFYCTRKSRENHLYLSIWDLCVQANAVWVLQCTRHISEMYDVDILRQCVIYYWRFYGWFFCSWWIIQAVFEPFIWGP